jgi:hypothetical protein
MEDPQMAIKLGTSHSFPKMIKLLGGDSDLVDLVTAPSIKIIVAGTVTLLCGTTTVPMNLEPVAIMMAKAGTIGHISANFALAALMSARSDLLKKMEGLDAPTTLQKGKKKPSHDGGHVSATFPIKASQPEPADVPNGYIPVKLADTEELGAPVKGTGGDSVYHMIGRGPNMKLALRYKESGNISLRAEPTHFGPFDSEVQQRLSDAGLDLANGGHYSLHANNVSPTVARKVVGSLIFSLNDYFDAYLDNVENFKGKGT